MKINKFKIFICAFLLLTTLGANMFLANSVENHIEQQRAFIKTLTVEQEQARYKIYREINSIKSDYIAFTVFTFMCSIFVVTFLIACEHRNRLENAKP